MLYYLYEHFGINLFHYISVRAIISFFIAFLLTLYLMPKFITWAKEKATQPIYDLAPENHQQKSKTPTMGGVVFISSAIIAIILTVKFNFFTIISLLSALGFMLIGIMDDWGKIKGKSNQAGLSAKRKFILQWILAFLIAFALYFYGFDTSLYIPFYKYPVIDMGIFAVVFWAFVIVGMSNAVNLTDGLDGLATIPSVFSFLTLSIFLYFSGNAIFSRYLYLPFELGVGEVVVISMALMGALLGFLWYNANPAEIFMGDSGSLTLGALIGLFAIFAKSEILLIFIGFVFIMETVSVILQVGSYKTRGKRIFLMAPIHHHFEELGWSENKITIRFWIIALITNIIAILSIKIR
ncbi:phospho-N-acetylmuramoyl-pentapeptide-transferase [Caminibacter pacificus]|uniref:Phospho-N-acetylmuramoyl-pentapeptide-transferase n=1 Tax=Caminibacter pacificus TaxID=1424653 RepID=A0AAJ4RCM2_9BACT|nr:phospho-N-acetylmuramoyl-pentapeptide-transferase [Caminibacter pacificus]NPA87940.1 phospho-N-acetylmuramoyl-pentapeptide-transferase [Campylobacterota bacterium]QCI27861.1 phospho-N-acetylmuramoyl-pentapeptide-transferase [Caminibacter pacificus]ROR39961.1 phospho-N-acetylmuramoyl-pentapeptide-transferase [Caminibacter pacificus]